jgi:hypothetical protein
MKRAKTIITADRAFTSVLVAEDSSIIITAALTSAILAATTATTNAFGE